MTHEMKIGDKDFGDIPYLLVFALYPLMGHFNIRCDLFFSFLGSFCFI